MSPSLIPDLIPGPALKKTGRRSNLIYHFRARDLALRALTGQAVSFTRASAGGFIKDRAGNFFQPVYGEPRFEAVDMDGDGVADDVALIVEPAASNVCPYSQDFSAWSLGGTPLLTANAIVRGALALSLIEDDDAVNNEWFETGIGGGTFSGTTPVYGSIYVQKHGSESASGPEFFIYDTTATTNRLQVSWTFNAAGVPTPVVTVGTLIATVNEGGGLYRIIVRATGIVNANPLRFGVRPCATSNQVGKTYAGGIQVEQSTGPSTYKITTSSAAAAAAADNVYSTLNFPPQQYLGRNFTVYVRSVERSSWEMSAGPSATSSRWVEIGGPAAARLLLYNSGGVPNAYMQYDASNSKQSAAAVNPFVWGDRAEVLGNYYADGSVAAVAEKNGTRLYGARSSAYAGPYPTAWGTNPRITFAGENANPNGRSGIVEVKVSTGILTLDQMREAL